jgi:hypothetical protein
VIESKINNQGFSWLTAIRRYRIGLWGGLLILGYFLLSEHRAHVVPYLPYLLLLACPFLHMFMHKGHGNHESNSHEMENSAIPIGHRHREEIKKEPK